MSKLSPALKAAISAPYARPNTVPAPKGIRSVYERLRKEATAKGVGAPSWLTVSTAATMTMNSPDSMTELFHLATADASDKSSAVATAELMREVGLKCISFNGIPRTINVLGAFRSNLPSDVTSQLSTTPTRAPTRENITAMANRGHSLWDSIYRPFESKLLSRLSDSHPDLPVHIINSHYSALLSDPSLFPPPQAPTGDPSYSNDLHMTESSPTPISEARIQAKIGRVLTSVVAVACLRAQSGVGPQVTSHIFGLRKAFEDGSWKAEGELEVQGGEWLASEEGNMWILSSVDSIVNAIGGGEGSNFAPGSGKSKL